jgi:hypothetical protein
MDAEVLRLREGLSLNKSLLGLGLVLRRLAQVSNKCRRLAQVATCGCRQSLWLKS